MTPAEFETLLNLQRDLWNDNLINLALLGCEQAWTPIIYLKSFDMDSVQVGKAVFVKKWHYPGKRTQNQLLSGEISYHTSVCWVKKKLVAIRHYIQVR